MALTPSLLTKALALAAFSAVSTASALQAQITVYVSPDGHQSAENTWSAISHPYELYTENFNSLNATASFLNGGSSYYSDSIHATYSSIASQSPTIKNEDQYGGKDQGKYLGLPESSTVSIDFDTSYFTNGLSYFGFFFSAGDVYNTIELFSGSESLLKFSTASLLQMLPRDSSITAINGDVYQSNDYYGQPTNTSANSNEAYAYLHFVADAGVSFDRVVLHQKPHANGSVFENDNHSVMETLPLIPDTWALVPVPEPSGALLVLGSALYFLFRRRK